MVNSKKNAWAANELLLVDQITPEGVPRTTLIEEIDVQGECIFCLAQNKPDFINCYKCGQPREPQAFSMGI